VSNLPKQVHRDPRLYLTFFLDEIDRSGRVIFARLVLSVWCCRCGAVGVVLSG
jgi:hypothetical protein